MDIFFRHSTVQLNWGNNKEVYVYCVYIIRKGGMPSWKSVIELRYFVSTSYFVIYACFYAETVALKRFGATTKWL